MENHSSVFTIPRATPIKQMDKFTTMVKHIHAGDHTSAITYDNVRAVFDTPSEIVMDDTQKSIIKSRKFLAWGDKCIIDGLSQFSRVDGEPIVMPELGVHGRGGSYFASGIWKIDEYKTGTQPLSMFCAYKNVAIIQEKFYKRV